MIGWKLVESVVNPRIISRQHMGGFSKLASRLKFSEHGQFGMPSELIKSTKKINKSANINQQTIKKNWATELLWPWQWLGSQVQETPNAFTIQLWTAAKWTGIELTPWGFHRTRECRNHWFYHPKWGVVDFPVHQFQDFPYFAHSKRRSSGGTFAL